MQRTLAWLREHGYEAAKTEHFNWKAKVRQDLFGFIDVLAVSDEPVCICNLLLMNTTASEGAVKVVFICVANSGRSVMAAFLLNELADGRHRATSAGSEPGDAVHPVVLQALDEIGIDASGHVPRRIDVDEIDRADVVVSTCGEEACPVTPPGVRRIYWSLPDPKNLPIEQVRPIRDEIRRRVEDLIVQLDGS